MEERLRTIQGDGTKVRECRRKLEDAVRQVKQVFDASQEERCSDIDLLNVKIVKIARLDDI